MTQKKQTIRNLDLFRFASTKRNLRIALPDFAFQHDNNNKSKDRFVGRDIQFRRLFNWLTSTSASGSYLITGYRGMGKSLLVKRVINAISRDPKSYKEVLYKVAFLCTFAAFYVISVANNIIAPIILFAVSVSLILFLHVSKFVNNIKFKNIVFRFPNHKSFDKELIAKYRLGIRDRRNRKYNRIAITINLGQEVLDERDVLSLVAQNIKETYSRFVNNRQNRPFISLLQMFTVLALGYFFYYYVLDLAIKNISIAFITNLLKSDSGLWILIRSVFELFFLCITGVGVLYHLLNVAIYALACWIVAKIISTVRNYIPFFSVPFKAIKRLEALTDRINATINEETGINSQPDNGLLSISIFNKKKNKISPMANVREIEHELMMIINDINSEDCYSEYRVQYIIVFDELDKITKAANKSKDKEKTTEEAPEFETSVKGFTDAMAYEERKQNVLRLLANMKMFITSVHAKCVFISGHELFDASMADLSDREFAISSIFNGVMNISSFLSPEREQTDVSSMTELYLANLLLPQDFIWKKMDENARTNCVLKEELPSLKWYNEYLMKVHIIDNAKLTKVEIRQKVEEIRYVIEFLKYFSVFLAHISNGSPKKISTYFDKYVKLHYDVAEEGEWGDTITVGEYTEKKKKNQCVLYFNATDQKLINFVYYIAAPVMNAITNEVSNYGDKLLVSSSFILDQIYKYHGRGFSWRNLEQMPELLNSNKNPELRDSMASIIEFLLQVHITTIPSGIFQYKFHKQISEEISTLSKISEEASAIFNFTLNESETVKRYNTKLLDYYLKLAKSSDEIGYYSEVLERIHENLGDLYYSEEDFYRSVHEYKCALKYIGPNILPSNILSYIKCSLKMGLAYENRRTYANAYMMYCQIINTLEHQRWVDESKLGLDHISRLTKDWRIKQPVLIEKKHDICLLEYQTENRLWEDEKERGIYDNNKYCLDSDKSISGFSKSYTPKKSDIFLQLTTFEDVKYVYQAILAKLFVIEKMELSGITQSSIDQAEAEFMALHSATNIKEKFMVAADFFGKMAEILYYKNNFVTAAPYNTYASALYNFDIDVFALLDEYLMLECGIGKMDAIEVKDAINKFFLNLKIEKESSGIKKFMELAEIKLSNITLTNEESSIIKGYLHYLDKKQLCDDGYLDGVSKRLQFCCKRREDMKGIGCKLPCHSCKYTNRSLKLLLDNMFEQQERAPKESKVIKLLINSSHKHIIHLRPQQVALLASTTEQMGNLMLSCSRMNVEFRENDLFTDSVIDLLCFLSKSTINEKERTDEIEKFAKEIGKKQLTRLDSAMLYYWAAYRYFEISSSYKEAGYCIRRIAKVMEDYLTVQEHISMYEGNKKCDVNERLIELMDNLFIHATRVLGHQYDNFNMAEIHEFKWLFHLGYADDIDLTKLTIFPDLQTIFLSIVRSKLIYHRILGNKDSYIEYINRIYQRISPSLQHNMTFNGEVNAYYVKAYLNRLVLEELFGGYETGKQYLINRKKVADNCDYIQPWCNGLLSYLKNERISLDDSIFKIDTSLAEEKIGLINFLIHDSMVCLSNILKVLTPHNHITSFSNCFTAEVYDLLWEWSKYYEIVSNIYTYYRYIEEDDISNQKILVSMMTRNTNCKEENMKQLMDEFVKIFKDNKILHCNESGYLYTALFTNIRHDMDDSTIHHIYTNYSAEMAIKYYKSSRSINSEGIDYKNMITGMYVLDDDLRNDTCQANLADERFLLNSGVINARRKWFQEMYEGSNINKIKHYEAVPKYKSSCSPVERLKQRYRDSIYINSEY